MKTSFLVTLAIALLLSQTGCKDMKKTLEQRNESRAKMQRLTTENNELEQKILTLKSAVPSTINTPQAALNLAERNEINYQHQEQELTKAIKSYEQTAASLKALETEVLPQSR